ncbi:MAG: amidohydrolase family protein [Balneolaceae bacterium]|nr:amidohydrolase family protein [Balneolaceae bacterium]
MRLIIRAVVLSISTSIIIGIAIHRGDARQAGSWPGSGHPYSLKADTTDSAATDSTEEKDNGDLPLEPERTISFTTTEGSWISVDVSPDGEQIAFDLMGDLYTIPIGGGKATRITEGMAYDTHPRYSPDGRYLLFTSDRSGADNIWYLDLEADEDADADERFHQVTKGNNRTPSAEWSPDGDYIAVAKGGLTNKLWLIHREGGSGAQLIDTPSNLKTIDPAFSHDGRFIYYSMRTGAWNYNAQLPQYQIGVYDRENGETSTITSRYGSAFTPTLSGDGEWMVYGSRYEDQTGLVLRNLENGDERWLAYPVQRDDQESIATQGVYPGMSFTPDNQALIAFYGGSLWRIPIDGGSAREIPFEVDLELQLGPRLDFTYPVDDSRQALATQIRDAVPSPDGRQLAFTVLNRLYVMDYPGGSPERLTDMDITEAQPAWSPDGRSIVYATWGPEEGGHLYKIDPNARRPRPERLTERPAIYGSPAWSYNSDRIVFLRGSAQAFRSSSGPFAYFGAVEDIAWISTEGGESHFIAKTDDRSNPHFVKGDDRIYMNRDNTLISLRWDGTDEKKHVTVTGIRTYGFGSSDPESWKDASGRSILHPGPTGAPEENNPPSPASIVSMAPEGDKALAQVNNEIYTVTVPKLGEAPKISVARPDNASFPSSKLTEIGGQFPGWSSDGRKVHWSIGNAHFVYDLDDAEAFADSVKAAKKAEAKEKKEKEDEGEENEKEQDSGDSGDQNEGEASEDGEKKENEEQEQEETYRAKETRIEVPYERDLPEGTALLQGARLITMDGDEIIEKGDILIEDNRIAAVGPSGTLEVPAGTRTIDLAGKTVIPGFVDTHAHMRPSWGIHKNQVWTYAANLAYGVTTTRDPQTGTTDVLTYADMVESGELLGSRIYSTGPGVGFWAYNIRDLEHANDVLKQYSEYYKTKYIKMYLTGNREQRQWILMASRDQTLLPTTEGALDWKLGLTQMIDGYPGHEHSFPIHPIYEDVIRVTAESKMAVTPTLLVAYGGPWAENYYYARERPYDDPKLNRFTPYSDLASKSRRRGFWSMEEEHVFYKHAEFMKDLVEAGGLAGVGSHGQLQGLGYHWELWATQAGGMDEHDALRVATILGAESLGLQEDMGSIEKGKLADLIILNRNPLDNIRYSNSIEYVMKNGRLYEGDTLDEIYPRQREAGPFWWHQQKPNRTLLPGVEE